jgi:16S rRNA (uracil1498-N3)-methyltransferase
MTFPRFYYPGQITAGQVIELPTNTMHHAIRVLRLEPGSKVTLFNGKGGEFPAFIECIGKTGVLVLTENYLGVERESPFHITLAQGICSSVKMDWIVRKTVELGVGDIQPITTKRSLVRLSDERAGKRVQHWRQIAISACEQCGRNRLPQVLSPMLLPDWLERQTSVQKNLRNEISQNLFFMLSPIAEKRLRDFSNFSSVANLTLLVGPEGGFTSEENATVLVAGFIPLRLGRRILRTESAALAAIAALQVLWGDF